MQQSECSSSVSDCLSAHRSGGGKLTVADIKLETLTMDDNRATGSENDVIAEHPAPEVEDDGAISDEEKQQILEDENITQVSLSLSLRDFYLHQVFSDHWLPTFDLNKTEFSFPT